MDQFDSEMIKDMLADELEKLRLDIQELDIENLNQYACRYGIASYDKHKLEQYYHYLAGLFELLIEEKLEEALENFYKSVSEPRVMIHEISKKALVQMYNILLTQMDKLETKTTEKQISRLK